MKCEARIRVKMCSYLQIRYWYSLARANERSWKRRLWRISLVAAHLDTRLAAELWRGRLRHGVQPAFQEAPGLFTSKLKNSTGTGFEPWRLSAQQRGHHMLTILFNRLFCDSSCINVRPKAKSQAKGSSSALWQPWNQGPLPAQDPKDI